MGFRIGKIGKRLGYAVDAEGRGCNSSPPGSSDFFLRHSGAM